MPPREGDIEGQPPWGQPGDPARCFLPSLGRHTAFLWPATRSVRRQHQAAAGTAVTEGPNRVPSPRSVGSSGRTTPAYGPARNRGPCTCPTSMVSQEPPKRTGTVQEVRLLQRTERSVPAQRRPAEALIPGEKQLALPWVQTWGWGHRAGRAPRQPGRVHLVCRPPFPTPSQAKKGGKNWPIPEMGAKVRRKLL